MSEDEIILTKNKSEAPPPRRKPKKITIPHRTPSVHQPEPTPTYITPDKTICKECICFPKEDPYVKNKKLIPCQKSPKTLYQLAAAVVDTLQYSRAFDWSKEDVADWLESIGFPEYKECMLDNKISGHRLLMLEDPSKLEEMNIKNFKHIQDITRNIRQLFSTEVVKFSRSTGLPPRKPLTHCTWFQSRTGPSWGIRENWTRCDILRWMKIIGPEPAHLNHWDLVWYQKPVFPKVLLARVKHERSQLFVPRYSEHVDVCREYLVTDSQKIYSPKEHTRDGPAHMEEREEPQRRPKIKIPRGESRLVPKRVSPTGLGGKELILAKRKTARPKFMP